MMLQLFSEIEREGERERERERKKEKSEIDVERSFGIVSKEFYAPSFGYHFERLDKN